jgi:hypothetical protein
MIVVVMNRVLIHNNNNNNNDDDDDDSDDDVEVPCGKLVFSGVRKGGAADESDLLYNEFIVYKTAQVRMRYLMKVQFHFK